MPDVPTCQKCGDPKPPVSGTLYCKPCAKLESWKSRRRAELRKYRDRQERYPCVRCGRPKGRGRGRLLCDRCRAIPDAPRPASLCVDCGVPIVGRGPQAMRCFEHNAEHKRWRDREAKRKVWHDPEKHAAVLAAQREAKRRRRAPDLEPPRDVDPEPRVPVLPLGEALQRIALKMGRIHSCEGDGLSLVCKCVGLKERTVYGWRIGEREETRLSRAEDVMTHVGLEWWDVWNEDTVHKYVFRAVVYKNAKARRTGPLGPWNAETIPLWIKKPGDLKLRPVGIKRVRLESTRYVDLGPDHEELKQIAENFEGKCPRRAAA